MLKQKAALQSQLLDRDNEIERLRAQVSIRKSQYSHIHFRYIDIIFLFIDFLELFLTFIKKKIALHKSQ